MSERTRPGMQLRAVSTLYWYTALEYSTSTPEYRYST